MKYLLLAIGLLYGALAAQAQYGVSGYLSAEQMVEGQQMVVGLYKLQLAADSNAFSSVQLATTQVGADGYFTFVGSLFTPEDGIYRIQLEGQTETLEAGDYRLFIHSNTDSLYFDRTNQAFDAYLSSNLADWEWRKLRELEERSAQSALQRELQLKDYVRDSLQILLVKLIGLKQLADKDLLARELASNPAYYTELLRKLEASELKAEDYAFLTAEQALLTQQTLARKYDRSRWANLLAVLLLLSLGWYAWQLQKRPAQVAAHAPAKLVALSKQEQLIRSLIIAGKSNKEIAAELFVSVHTVKSHITNLYRKLGIKSRKEVLSHTKS